MPSKIKMKKKQQQPKTNKQKKTVATCKLINNPNNLQCVIKAQSMLESVMAYLHQRHSFHHRQKAHNHLITGFNTNCIQ